MKKWYQSRTLWLNIIALVATIVELSTGHILTAAIQDSIVAFLNMILRFRTNETLTK